MTENNEKKPNTKQLKVKEIKAGVWIAKWKFITKIVIAAIGLIGVCISAIFSYLSSVTAAEASKEAESTMQEVKVVVERIDKVIIPTLNRELQRLVYDLTELSQDEAAARERIAYLEGMFQGLRELLPKRVSENLPAKPHPGTTAILEKMGLAKKPKAAMKTRKIDLPQVQMQRAAPIFPAEEIDEED